MTDWPTRCIFIIAAGVSIYELGKAIAFGSIQIGGSYFGYKASKTEDKTGFLILSIAHTVIIGLAFVVLAGFM